MPKTPRRRGALALLWLTLAGPVLAAESDAWSDAVASFEAGDFRTALAAFEAIRDSGQPGPAVEYNIAVCQFELGLFPEADATFASLGERFPQMRPLAEYNRGLAAIELGRQQEARDHFDAAYRLAASDDKLRALARAMSSGLEPPVEPTNGMSGAVGIRVGHDDNVVLRDETGLPAGTSAQSTFADVYATVAVPIGREAGGLYATGSLFAVRYPDAEEFDQAAIEAGLGHEWRSNSMRFRVAAVASHSTFGGDSFDNTAGLGIESDYAVSADRSITVGFARTGIDAGNSRFGGIDGTRTEISASYRWHFPDWRLEIGLAGESNDRTDPGLTSERKRVFVRYRYWPSSAWSVRLGAEFRRSDFDEIETPRTEDRTTFLVGIGRRLGSSWEATADLRFADNRSTDSLYSYRRNLFALGLQRGF